MNTTEGQWKAVAIKGIAQTDKGPMPEFDFPSDYSPAPSLYKMQDAQKEANCELCGHPIKIVYWLQHDNNKWIMAVGSECVTHFGEKSGERITKETIWQMNRDFVNECLDFFVHFEQVMTLRKHIGYGRYSTHWRTTDPKTHAAIRIIKDRLCKKVSDADSDGVITRWVKRYADEIKEAIAILEQDAAYNILA